MPPSARKSPALIPTPPAKDRGDANAAPATTTPDDATPPPGWQAPAPGTRGRAAFRRTDGAEVFFDRRSRADDPLDALRPGWNWMARRPEGTMLGHRVAAPVGGPVPEGGLFLPRKFKTAGEAMRALDRDAPAAAIAAVVVRHPEIPTPRPAAGGPDNLAGMLALLESRGGDLLGLDGALLPRVGLTWEQVALDGPLTLAVLPPGPDDGGNGRPRGALADRREAAARGFAVLSVGVDDVCALRRLAEKLVAAPGVGAARALREFLDFLVAGAAATPFAATPKPPRKRLSLKAA